MTDVNLRYRNMLESLSQSFINVYQKPLHQGTRNKLSQINPAPINLVKSYNFILKSTFLIIV